MSNQFFEIRLEDYSYPRYASRVKSYYGTREDIDKLIAYLKDDDNLRVRYAETIEAAEAYDGTNVPIHNVAGQLLPILTPVQEVCRFETQLNNQDWNYETRKDGVYPCHAAKVTVCQILIRTETGYERCLKARLSNLCFCLQRQGWVRMNVTAMGFPGVVTRDNGDYVVNLFASIASYQPDQLDEAMADVGDFRKIDLSVITADILAEG